jgi:hypothetical protein
MEEVDSIATGGSLWASACERLAWGLPRPQATMLNIQVQSYVVTNITEWPAAWIFGYLDICHDQDQVVCSLQAPPPWCEF